MKISDRVTTLSRESECVRNELNAKLEELQAEFDRKNELLSNCKDFLNLQKQELTKTTTGEYQRAAEDLRNAIRKIIDGGIVGGPQLEQAFKDHLNEINQGIIEAIQPRFMEVSSKIVENLQSIENTPVDLKNESCLDAVFSEQTKIHSLYGKIGGAVGTISTTLTLSTMVAGAVEGATVGLIGGPWGAAAGFAAGAAVVLLVGFLGSFIGNKGREYHLNSQKETARQQLFKYIDEFRTNSITDYKKIIQNFVNTISINAEKWLEVEKSLREADIKRLQQDTEKSGTEKKSLLVELNSDKAELENHLITVKGLHHA